MSAPTRWSWLSLAAILAVGVAALIGGESTLRTLVVAWFLITCPGMVLARLIDVEPGFAEASLGIGLSVSINILVALTLVYLGLWSAGAAFALIGAFTVVAAAVLARRGRATA